MNKKMVLSFLTLASFVLASVQVQAEETSPIDSSAPVEVITPTAPIVSPEPEIPTPPSEEKKEDTPVSPVVPIDPTNPSTGEEQTTPVTPPVEENKPSEPSKEVEEIKPSEPPKKDSEVIPETPKTEEKQETLPSTAEEASQAGKSQIGTTSTVTGQVVVNPVEQPVMTNTGYQIVGTQSGQVLVAYGDGTSSLLSVEEVGGITNKDKTILVTKADGQKVTLPETGSQTKMNIFVSIVGWIALATTILSHIIVKKKKAN